MAKHHKQATNVIPYKLTNQYINIVCPNVFSDCQKKNLHLWTVFSGQSHFGDAVPWLLKPVAGALRNPAIANWKTQSLRAIVEPQVFAWSIFFCRKYKWARFLSNKDQTCVFHEQPTSRANTTVGVITNILWMCCYVLFCQDWIKHDHNSLFWSVKKHREATKSPHLGWSCVIFIDQLNKSQNFLKIK